MADQPVFDFRKPKAGPSEPRYVLERPVFFVGFMGAGKTSVARKLARFANIASIDMDMYIERTCDRKVSQIFEESGEEGFRALETAVLEELAQGEPRLISCGGGVVLSPRNRQILQENGFVIYLEVTAAEAASRISDTSTRPLFGDLERAQQVIVSRLPLYEEVANATIDTAGRNAGQLARTAMDILKKEGVLWRQR